MDTMQKLFLKEKSFDGYGDTDVLTCLLTTAGIRTDIPALIERLFVTFGSLKGILEATPAQLMRVPGVSKKTAALIAMITPLARVWERCCMNDPTSIVNYNEAAKYCRSLLMGERHENFYVICLNARCKVLGVRKITEGTLSSTASYPRNVAETALSYNAHSVMLCHNHPGGTNMPSQEDLESTLQLRRVLNSLDILLLDHFIVAGTDVYSMAQHGDLEFGRLAR